MSGESSRKRGRLSPQSLLEVEPCNGAEGCAFFHRPRSRTAGLDDPKVWTGQCRSWPHREVLGPTRAKPQARRFKDSSSDHALKMVLSAFNDANTPNG
ncbi:hypothetical protein [Salinibacter phage 5_9]